MNGNIRFVYFGALASFEVQVDAWAEYEGVDWNWYLDFKTQ